MKRPGDLATCGRADLTLNSKPDENDARTAEPVPAVNSGFPLGKIFLLAVGLVVILLVVTVYVLGESSYLPFKYEGF